MSVTVSNMIKAENIAALYNKLKQTSDEENAEKILDLLEKVEKNEFIISFSGHFSAGKSTMINYLLQEEVLPQSPIPTSANVVKLLSGRGYARVFFKKESPIEYEEPYDLDVIKAYCKNGDAINKVEISKKTTVIPGNVAILDTPGIDSSNDADRVMTESSLHTVDVIFYIMDYNHVQSEVNLTFLKEMQKRNKPLYLVVNQVDKHREEELTFQKFKQSVKQTLSNWKIYPECLYFTSLKEKNNPFNELHDLKRDIHQLMRNGNAKNSDTIENSLKYILDQHVHWLNNFNAEKKDHLTNQLKELDDQDGMSFSDLHQSIQTIKEKEKSAGLEFRTVVNDTLKNAYLMPFELREKAETLLKSYKPRFKVGIISTKKKVESVRRERLNAFYDSFMDLVKAAIEWKLREKLLTFAKNYQVTDINILDDIQSFSVEYGKQRLIDLIKHGAELTGEYLLVYTDDVSNDVKQLYKQESSKLFEKINSVLKQNNKQELKELQLKMDNIKEKEAIENKLNQLNNSLIREEETLQRLSGETISDNAVLQLARKELNNRKLDFQVFTGVHKKASLNVVPQESEVLQQRKTTECSENSSVAETVEHVTTTLELINHLPGFQTIKEDLIQKRKRLEQRHYTVALFGAFSAGKSSFANALLGEKVLPVSPNPTTAVINKISPPNQQHPHGTVIVKIKKEKTVISDINQLLGENGSIDNLGENLQWIRDKVLPSSSIDEKQRSFLNAVIDGYEHMAQDLDSVRTITMKQFSDYVSKEPLACYIEWMELFYDCPLTNQGITLVDTPGADSVNARHTDLSFQYIKQADAILFVTYYNHAFSKADSTFLKQLGRVKDAFSLDKMFFIVNAKDLAKDNEELGLVTAYVSEQLRGFGIQQPRMFAVSSKLAMEQSQENSKVNAGLDLFEKDFYQFINQELMEILISSTHYDITRVRDMLRKYMEAASMNNKEKQVTLDNLHSQKEKLIKLMKNFDTVTYNREIAQKGQKQVYYVKHRISIQFIDYFREAFNPATIKSNGNEAKQELNSCLKTLLRSVGYELAEEMRAVSLRMEAFINDKAKGCNSKLNAICQDIENELSLARIDDFSIESPKFETAFKAIDRTIFTKALNQFKNTKSFFEKNGRDNMRFALYEELESHIDAYLETNKQEMLDGFEQEWTQIDTEIKSKAISTIEQYFDGIIHSLSNRVDTGELKDILGKLERLSS